MVFSFQMGKGLDFISFMAMVGVQDTSFSRSQFTWCNNRGGHARISKQLVKCFITRVRLV